MTRLQSMLSRACEELGLTVAIPFTMSLPDGGELRAQALLPQLGASKGMVIVSNYEDLLGRADELVASDYGYSVLSEPEPTETYDVESFAEMFRDWGWSGGAEKKPAWMQEPT